MGTRSAVVEVVAGVVLRDARVLVCRRPAGKRHAGLWEFPGGKLAPGESLAQALARELDEELGLCVESCGAPLFETQDPGSPYRLHFVPTHARGEPEAREHSALNWCWPAELEKLSLAPGDARFVRWLVSQNIDLESRLPV